MSSIGRPVLSAGAATALGEVIECSGIAHLHLFAKVTVTVGDLSGNIQFAATPDGTGNLLTAAAAPNIVSPGVTIAETVAPTGFTLDATAAQITIASAAVGTSVYAVRITNPPQYVVPRFNYTSGGGTVSVVVYAFGFSTLSR